MRKNRFEFPLVVRWKNQSSYPWESSIGDRFGHCIVFTLTQYNTGNNNRAWILIARFDFGYSYRQ